MMMGPMVVITKDRIIKTCKRNLWAEDLFLWINNLKELSCG